MTTVIADARLGVMVADSNVSDGERCGSMRKVWRIRGALVGCAGNLCDIEPFVQWVRDGADHLTRPRTPHLSALVLADDGLRHFVASDPPILVQSGREAIGSGAMAVLAVHEALDFSDPARAVRIVCKHDAGSRGPVRTYRLRTAR